ncbi:MAG: DNA-directed RNA polymerase subunit beta [Mycoplasmatales bacterium]|nr:DNA-directed RNA polymerase subunit beta [Mycoplasmatales bacterium]
MAKEKKYVVKRFGPITKRRDYSKTVNNLPVTDLVATQKESFKWFLSDGIDETFKNIYPIVSTNGRITIEYLKNTLRLEKPNNEFESVKQAKQKGTTYGVKVYATLRKIDQETAEVKEQEVLFGEIPLMTSGASFIINGSEKVIVSQLLRSPGAYYSLNVPSQDGNLFNRLEIIPRLGIWIDIHHKLTGVNASGETKLEKSDFIKVYIDKKKVGTISTFLRALGMTKDNIIDLYGNLPVVHKSIKNDKLATEEEALERIHGILRKGDRITEESKKNLFANILFNKRRYDLSTTGRYTMNRKLNIIDRIDGTILAESLKSKDGRVIYKEGTKIDFELATEIHESFVSKILEKTEIPGITNEIFGKQLEDFPNLNDKTKIVKVKVYPNLIWKEMRIEPINVIGNDPHSTEQHLLPSDIVASFGYYINLSNQEDKIEESNKFVALGTEDDPDSLINKRIVTMGELLQNQLQIGLTKMERNAKERMSSKEQEKITPKNITNNKAIYNQFKSFFNSSQLSQFMDQMNPLAELSNKRRVTSLGPGGLNRDTASFEVRDVHTTHYGRLCPIETPEGPNIGLILSFANYARVNKLGFIETPYYKVENKKINIKKIVYLTAAEEVSKTFAQSSIELDENGKIKDGRYIVRKNSEYITVSADEIDYIDVSSRQIASVASSAIPFLENDDANRALMGANMQRQAVPLIETEAPLVGTGVEADVAKFSASNIRSQFAGTVSYVDSQIIEIKNESKIKRYQLRSFERSNQGSVITQKPIVSVGQKIKVGDLLTDGPSFDNGELAIGKNIIVAFTTWKGYNYEDAIIMSESLVKGDVYTSVHIEEQTIQFRKSKVGDDELSLEIPNVSIHSKRNLDSRGIVRIGSEVQAGDILVGRVSPKGEDNPTPEEKLIQAIFTQKSKNIKDTSLKVKNGHGGTIIDVEVLSREDGDELQDDVSMIVKVYIAKKRKIKEGDKMAGRHGNKGIISRILPIEDMPHLADGTPVDIMLNPQGVPSRMNIGQVLELHLGMAAKKLNVKFASPVFDGIKHNDINSALKEANLPENGKFDLFDPITGKKFDSKISVGVMYMLKLAHMVDDKMHARSVGPYSLITQQPLGGKSQNGGQRFGEMETWAVESYGATNVLQELLTYKSDNIDGRNKVYNSLANGAPLPTPGTPESFNVLAYELRGLGIKLGVHTKEEGEN